MDILLMTFGQFAVSMVFLVTAILIYFLAKDYFWDRRVARRWNEDRYICKPAGLLSNVALIPVTRSRQNEDDFFDKIEDFRNDFS